MFYREQDSLWMQLEQRQQGRKALLTVGIICAWVSHSWTSVWQLCVSPSSIYVLFCPNHQTASQEKPQWLHHRFAAKALHNTATIWSNCSRWVCCYVLCYFVLVLLLSLICLVHQILAAVLSSDSNSFSGICLWRLCVHMSFKPTGFVSVLHFAAEFLFCHVV